MRSGIVAKGTRAASMIDGEVLMDETLAAYGATEFFLELAAAGGCRGMRNRTTTGSVCPIRQVCREAWRTAYVLYSGSIQIASGNWI